MAATPDDLFAFLDRLGIAHPTVTHVPVFTVEESRTLRGTIAGAHTKNLFLVDKKGTLYLVVALEDAAIELKSLHRRLGASGRFSFATAETLRATLGVERCMAQAAGQAQGADGDKPEMRLLLSLRYRIRNDLGLPEDAYDALLD